MFAKLFERGEHDVVSYLVVVGEWATRSFACAFPIEPVGKFGGFLLKLTEFSTELVGIECLNLAVGFPVIEVGMIFFGDCGLEPSDGIENISLQPLYALSKCCIEWCNLAEAVGRGLDAVPYLQAFISKRGPEGLEAFVI